MKLFYVNAFQNGELESKNALFYFKTILRAVFILTLISAQTLVPFFFYVRYLFLIDVTCLVIYLVKN